jgi:hypothetical protein
VRGFRLVFLLGCVILVYLRLLFLLGCVILVYVNLFFVLASKPINTGLDPLEKQFIIIIGFCLIRILRVEFLGSFSFRL